MINRDLLYFCKRCQSAKPSKIVTVYPHIKAGDDKTKEDVEVIKTFETIVSDGDKSETRQFKARQLSCNHYVSYYTPGFKGDTNSNNGSNTPNVSPNLSDEETQEIRRKIEMELIGLQAKELEKVILFHVEQYQTLLKIATKQLKQAKYAIQFIDQLREKYVAALTEDDKYTFEQKFAHFLDLKPTTNRTIERQRKETDKDADKQKLALEAVKALLGKSGYKAKELFNKGE